MQFIETDHGYIPEPRVVTIKYVRDLKRWRVEYDAGIELAVTYSDFRENEIGDYVPAAPGYFTVEVSDGEAHLTPVIAWRIDRNCATAVTFDHVDTDNMAILCPDGRVIEPFSRAYESLELMLRYTKPS